MDRFRHAGADRLRHLRLQGSAATDPDFKARIEAAVGGIASMLAGIQDFSTAIFARIDQIEAKRLEAAKLGLALQENTKALERHFTEAPVSGDAPRVLADAYDAMEDALLVTLLLAISTADAVVAGDGDSTLLGLLAEASKMLLESFADGALPGVGFFLSAFEKVNELRTRRARRAEEANALLADLTRIIQGSAKWRGVHDEVIVGLA